MYTLVSPSYMCFISNLPGFDWPSGFREKIFEYYVDIHLYCPRVGADRPIGSIFKNHISSVHLPISLMFFSSNDFLTNFPFKCMGHLC